MMRERTDRWLRRTKRVETLSFLFGKKLSCPKSEHLQTVSKPKSLCTLCSTCSHLYKGLDGLEALDLLILGHALRVERGELTADVGILLEERPSQRLYTRSWGGIRIWNMMEGKGLRLWALR